MTIEEAIKKNPFNPNKGNKSAYCRYLRYNVSGWYNLDSKEVLKRWEERDELLDKIRGEIIDTLYVDSLIFGELIDFKNGKISADDVIEEFNRVTRIEVLKIINKYKEESEEKE